MVNITLDLVNVPVNIPFIQVYAAGKTPERFAATGATFDIVEFKHDQNIPRINGKIEVDVESLRVLLDWVRKNRLTQYVILEKSQYSQYLFNVDREINSKLNDLDRKLKSHERPNNGFSTPIAQLYEQYIQNLKNHLTNFEGDAKRWREGLPVQDDNKTYKDKLTYEEIDTLETSTQDLKNKILQQFAITHGTLNQLNIQHQFAIIHDTFNELNRQHNAFLTSLNGLQDRLSRFRGSLRDSAIESGSDVKALQNSYFTHLQSKYQSVQRTYDDLEAQYRDISEQIGQGNFQNIASLEQLKNSLQTMQQSAGQASLPLVISKALFEGLNGYQTIYDEGVRQFSAQIASTKHTLNLLDETTEIYKGLKNHLNGLIKRQETVQNAAETLRNNLNQLNVVDFQFEHKMRSLLVQCASVNISYPTRDGSYQYSSIFEQLSDSQQADDKILQQLAEQISSAKRVLEDLDKTTLTYVRLNAHLDDLIERKKIIKSAAKTFENALKKVDFDDPQLEKSLRDILAQREKLNTGYPSKDLSSRYRLMGTAEISALQSLKKAEENLSQLVAARQELSAVKGSAIANVQALQNRFFEREIKNTQSHMNVLKRHLEQIDRTSDLQGLTKLIHGETTALNSLSLPTWVTAAQFKDLADSQVKAQAKYFEVQSIIEKLKGTIALLSEDPIKEMNQGLIASLNNSLSGLIKLEKDIQRDLNLIDTLRPEQVAELAYRLAAYGRQIPKPNTYAVEPYQGLAKSEKEALQSSFNFQQSRDRVIEQVTRLTHMASEMAAGPGKTRAIEYVAFLKKQLNFATPDLDRSAFNNIMQSSNSPIQKAAQLPRLFAVQIEQLSRAQANVNSISKTLIAPESFLKLNQSYLDTQDNLNNARQNQTYIVQRITSMQALLDSRQPGSKILVQNELRSLQQVRDEYAQSIQLLEKRMVQLNNLDLTRHTVDLNENMAFLPVVPEEKSAVFEKINQAETNAIKKLNEAKKEQHVLNKSIEALAALEKSGAIGKQLIDEKKTALNTSLNDVTQLIEELQKTLEKIPTTSFKAVPELTDKLNQATHKTLPHPKSYTVLDNFKHLNIEEREAIQSERELKDLVQTFRTHIDELKKPGDGLGRQLFDQYTTHLQTVLAENNPSSFALELHETSLSDRVDEARKFFTKKTSENLNKERALQALPRITRLDLFERINQVHRTLMGSLASLRADVEALITNANTLEKNTQGFKLLAQKIIIIERELANYEKNITALNGNISAISETVITDQNLLHLVNALDRVHNTLPKVVSFGRYAALCAAEVVAQSHLQKAQGIIQTLEEAIHAAKVSPVASVLYHTYLSHLNAQLEKVEKETQPLKDLLKSMDKDTKILAITKQLEQLNAAFTPIVPLVLNDLSIFQQINLAYDSAKEQLKTLQGDLNTLIERISLSDSKLKSMPENTAAYRVLSQQLQLLQNARIEHELVINAVTQKIKKIEQVTEVNSNLPQQVSAIVKEQIASPRAYDFVPPSRLEELAIHEVNIRQNIEKARAQLSQLELDIISVSNLSKGTTDLPQTTRLQNEYLANLRQVSASLVKNKDKLERELQSLQKKVVSNQSLPEVSSLPKMIDVPKKIINERFGEFALLERHRLDTLVRVRDLIGKTTGQIESIHKESITFRRLQKDNGYLKELEIKAGTHLSDLEKITLTSLQSMLLKIDDDKKENEYGVSDKICLNLYRAEKNANDAINQLNSPKGSAHNADLKNAHAQTLFKQYQNEYSNFDLSIKSKVNAIKGLLNLIESAPNLEQLTARIEAETSSLKQIQQPGILEIRHFQAFDLAKTKVDATLAKMGETLQTLRDARIKLNNPFSEGSLSEQFRTDKLDALDKSIGEVNTYITRLTNANTKPSLSNMVETTATLNTLISTAPASLEATDDIQIYLDVAQKEAAAMASSSALKKDDVSLHIQTLKKEYNGFKRLTQTLIDQYIGILQPRQQEILVAIRQQPVVAGQSTLKGRVESAIKQFDEKIKQNTQVQNALGAIPQVKNIGIFSAIDREYQKIHKALNAAKHNASIIQSEIEALQRKRELLPVRFTGSSLESLNQLDTKITNKIAVLRAQFDQKIDSLNSEKDANATSIKVLEQRLRTLHSLTTSNSLVDALNGFQKTSIAEVHLRTQQDYFGSDAQLSAFKHSFERANRLLNRAAATISGMQSYQAEIKRLMGTTQDTTLNTLLSQHNRATSQAIESAQTNVKALANVILANVDGINMAAKTQKIEKACQDFKSPTPLQNELGKFDQLKEALSRVRAKFEAEKTAILSLQSKTWSGSDVDPIIKKKYEAQQQMHLSSFSENALAVLTQQETQFERDIQSISQSTQVSFSHKINQLNETLRHTNPKSATYVADNTLNSLIELNALRHRLDEIKTQLKAKQENYLGDANDFLVQANTRYEQENAATEALFNTTFSTSSILTIESVRELIGKYRTTISAAGQALDVYEQTLELNRVQSMMTPRLGQARGVVLGIQEVLASFPAFDEKSGSFTLAQKYKSALEERLSVAQTQVLQFEASWPKNETIKNAISRLNRLNTMPLAAMPENLSNQLALFHGMYKQAKDNEEKARAVSLDEGAIEEERNQLIAAKQQLENKKEFAFGKMSEILSIKTILSSSELSELYGLYRAYSNAAEHVVAVLSESVNERLNVRGAVTSSGDEMEKYLERFDKASKIFDAFSKVAKRQDNSKPVYVSFSTGIWNLGAALGKVNPYYLGAADQKSKSEEADKAVGALLEAESLATELILLASVIEDDQIKAVYQNYQTTDQSSGVEVPEHILVEEIDYKALHAAHTLATTKYEGYIGALDAAIAKVGASADSMEPEIKALMAARKDELTALMQAAVKEYGALPTISSSSLKTKEEAVDATLKFTTFTEKFSEPNIAEEIDYGALNTAYASAKTKHEGYIGALDAVIAKVGASADSMEPEIKALMAARKDELTALMQAAVKEYGALPTISSSSLKTKEEAVDATLKFTTFTEKFSEPNIAEEIDYGALNTAYASAKTKHEGYIGALDAVIAKVGASADSMEPEIKALMAARKDELTALMNAAVKEYGALPTISSLKTKEEAVDATFKFTAFTEKFSEPNIAEEIDYGALNTAYASAKTKHEGYIGALDAAIAKVGASADSMEPEIKALMAARKDELTALMDAAVKEYGALPTISSLKTKEEAVDATFKFTAFTEKFSEPNIAEEIDYGALNTAYKKAQNLYSPYVVAKKKLENELEQINSLTNTDTDQLVQNRINVIEGEIAAIAEQIKPWLEAVEKLKPLNPQTKTEIDGLTSTFNEVSSASIKPLTKLMPSEPLGDVFSAMFEAKGKAGEAISAANEELSKLISKHDIHVRESQKGAPDAPDLIAQGYNADIARVLKSFSESAEQARTQATATYDKAKTEQMGLDAEYPTRSKITEVTNQYNQAFDEATTAKEQAKKRENKDILPLLNDEHKPLMRTQMAIDDAKRQFNEAKGKLESIDVEKIKDDAASAKLKLSGLISDLQKNEAKISQSPALIYFRSTSLKDRVSSFIGEAVFDAEVVKKIKQFERELLGSKSLDAVKKLKEDIKNDLVAHYSSSRGTKPVDPQIEKNITEYIGLKAEIIIGNDSIIKAQQTIVRERVMQEEYKRAQEALNTASKTLTQADSAFRQVMHKTTIADIGQDLAKIELLCNKASKSCALSNESCEAIETPRVANFVRAIRPTEIAGLQYVERIIRHDEEASSPTPTPTPTSSSANAISASLNGKKPYDLQKDYLGQGDYHATTIIFPHPTDDTKRPFTVEIDQINPSKVVDKTKWDAFAPPKNGSSFFSSKVDKEDYQKCIAYRANAQEIAAIEMAAKLLANYKPGDKITLGPPTANLEQTERVYAAILYLKNMADMKELKRANIEVVVLNFKPPYALQTDMSYVKNHLPKSVDSMVNMFAKAGPAKGVANSAKELCSALREAGKKDELKKDELSQVKEKEDELKEGTSLLMKRES